MQLLDIIIYIKMPLVNGDNKNTDTASQKYFIEILQLCFFFLFPLNLRSDITIACCPVHVKKARMMVFVLLSERNR